MHEKPLMIFKQLLDREREGEGERPMFMLRKI